MEIDLFAGIAVRDHAAAVGWYARFLGGPATSEPHATESVWTVADHGHVYVVQDPGRAGSSLVTLFVEDVAGFVAAVSGRGIEPASEETYDNGVRKVTYRDPDGNEVGVGGGPTAGPTADGS